MLLELEADCKLQDRIREARKQEWYRSEKPECTGRTAGTPKAVGNGA